MNFDFDFRSFQQETQKSLAKIFSESNEVMEDEPTEVVDETYNKVQRILDCPEMEKSHPYLYSLDLENLSEDDHAKIDKIYDLGVQRGVLDVPDDDSCADVSDDRCDDNLPLCGGPTDALTDQTPTPQERPEPPMSNFTVLYSGMKDGQVKTGEFYSKTTDIESAKDDCVSSMTAAGYTGIRVLAIEQNVHGVDTDVKEEPAGVNYYDVYKEDDSEEFEKQETGDTEDGTKKDDEDSTDDSTEDSSEDNTDDGNDDSEEKSDDEGSEDGDSSDGDDETEDSDKSEGDDDSKEDGDSEEDSDKKEKDDDEEEEELPAEEKALYKDEYEKLFKLTLKKLKTGKSVQDMDIAQKTKFWTEISKKWSKAEPSRFLSDKEQEKLNKLVVKQDEKIV